MSSTPNTLPSPPFIPINRIANFRTIGAHSVPGTGQQTRSNLVYRSGAPTGTGDDTAAVLRALRIGTLYDVRSAREIERLKARTPVVDFPGVQRVFCPVFEHRDGAPETLARRLADYAEIGPQGFVRAYAEILDCGVDAYRRIFAHVRDRPDEPFAVHCTAGKDRTGVVIALMLSLVGVPDEQVAIEYNLTELGLKDEIEKWIPHMLQEPAYKGDEEAVRRSLSARKDSMEGTLVMLKEEWGGAEGYLRKGLGFSNADIEKIKANLLEPIEEDTFQAV